MNGIPLETLFPNLFIVVGVHGDEGGDGGVGDAGDRGEHTRRPHHPLLGTEPVPHQLQME